MLVADRRGSVRASVSLLAAIETGRGETPVLVVELSAAGVRIQADDAPEAGRQYLLHFSVHHTEYTGTLKVVHWENSDGSFHWGCSLLGLPPEKAESLVRAVNAVAGIASVVIRPWAEIAAEARDAATQVLVGLTPGGQEIRLDPADALEIGPEGIDLFVRTVGGLEAT